MSPESIINKIRNFSSKKIVTYILTGALTSGFNYNVYKNFNNSHAAEIKWEEMKPEEREEKVLEEKIQEEINPPFKETGRESEIPSCDECIVRGTYFNNILGFKISVPSINWGFEISNEEKGNIEYLLFIKSDANPLDIILIARMKEQVNSLEEFVANYGKKELQEKREYIYLNNERAHQIITMNHFKVRDQTFYVSRKSIKLFKNKIGYLILAQYDFTYEKDNKSLIEIDKVINSFYFTNQKEE
ncbi:MAG: hypothetical protein AB1571_00995 [Nanoarchaeota archaeon]